MSDKQANTQEPQVLLGQLLFGKQMTYCLSGMARLGGRRSIAALDAGA